MGNKYLLLAALLAAVAPVWAQEAQPAAPQTAETETAAAESEVSNDQA